MAPCVFCNRIEAGDYHWSNNDAVAFSDGFPISTGHTLVVPREHEPDFFDLNPETRAAMWALIDEVRLNLIARFSPDGFNIGVNIGTPAGQTVGHAHIHLIPRYAGDVTDPRGGVRWVIAERAPYWSPPDGDAHD